MTLNATLDTSLSRVRLNATSLAGSGAGFSRSMNGVTWTTVRGGSNIVVSGGSASVDDYEFVSNQVNYYRVISGATTNVITYTPVQNGVWLKSITRPWLNTAVSITDLSDIELPARVQLFEVIGSSYPISVSDVRSSRRWTATITTKTVSDADRLELVFAGGDPLFIQTDGLHDIPGGYVVAGDVVRSRFGKRDTKRDFAVLFTVVKPPGPAVVGTTNTWDALVAEFGTWTNVLANFSTWAEVAEYVASPQVVIVP